MSEMYIVPWGCAQAASAFWVNGLYSLREYHNAEFQNLHYSKMLLVSTVSLNY